MKTKQPTGIESILDKTAEDLGAETRRPKGILIVSPAGRSGRGGISSVSRAIAEWIETTSPDVKVFVVDARGTGPSWLWPLFLIKAFAYCLTLRLTGKIDVLHLQVSERSSFIRKGLLLLLGRSLGLGIVLHHHGAQLISFYREASSPMRRWVSFIARRANVNIVLGERWRPFLIEEVGVPSGQVVVLYNAIRDLLKIDQMVRESGSLCLNPSIGFHFVTLADMSPRKGISELLRALKIVRDQRSNVRATIAGGGQVSRYVREAEKLGIDDICLFPGWIDREAVEELLRSADTFVLPSFDEGLPIAILEALSARIPVIATPVGSIPEVLTDGVSCLMVQPGNVEQLADTLRKIATDAALVERLATNGRDLFESKFTIDRFMKTLFQLYSFCLQRDSGRDVVLADVRFAGKTIR
jgi:glycosyltransferase involved in cell wall biosynthesis